MLLKYFAAIVISLSSILTIWHISLFILINRVQEGYFSDGALSSKSISIHSYHTENIKHRGRKTCSRPHRYNLKSNSGHCPGLGLRLIKELVISYSFLNASRYINLIQ